MVKDDKAAQQSQEKISTTPAKSTTQVESPNTLKTDQNILQDVEKAVMTVVQDVNQDEQIGRASCRERV